MGAWGAGPFENDDAGDWSYGFDGADEASGHRLLAEALHLGAPDEYVEATAGSVAVAAAAVVSWLHAPDEIPDPPDGESPAAWVRAVGPGPYTELTAAALAALDRVRGDDSELAELWDGDEAWPASLDQIEARLRPGPTTGGG